MERLALLVRRKKSAEKMKAKNIMQAEKEETGKQEVPVDLSFFFHIFVRNCRSQKGDQLGLCFPLESLNQESITLTKILTVAYTGIDILV